MRLEKITSKNLCFTIYLTAMSYPCLHLNKRKPILSLNKIAELDNHLFRNCARDSKSWFKSIYHSKTIAIFKKMQLLFIMLLISVAATAMAKQCPDGTMFFNGVCIHSAPNQRLRAVSNPRRGPPYFPECPSGTRQIDRGRFQPPICDACPPGSFNYIPGATECTKCPIDVLSRDLGPGCRKTPKPKPIARCLPDQYYSPGQCMQCPPGMCSTGAGGIKSCFPSDSINCLRRF